MEFAWLAAASSLVSLGRAWCIDGLGGSWQFVQPAQQFSEWLQGVAQQCWMMKWGGQWRYLRRET